MQTMRLDISPMDFLLSLNTAAIGSRFRTYFLSTIHQDADTTQDAGTGNFRTPVIGKRPFTTLLYSCLPPAEAGQNRRLLVDTTHRVRAMNNENETPNDVNGGNQVLLQRFVEMPVRWRKN